MSILYTILQIVGMLILIFAVVTIKQIPSAVSKKVSDERSFYNSKQLQIDNYFRQSNGKNMQEVLREWVKIINDVDHSVMQKTRDLQNLLNQTLTYSSGKTIKLIGIFLQSVYKNGDEITDDVSQLVYVALIVENLKIDFTGEKIDAIDLLKVKYNDYDQQKEALLTAEKEIKRRLESEV